MGLTLRQLPSLLTDCVLIAHGQQAGVVWTQREFFGICLHMLNDNPPNFFLMPFQDKEGRPQYKRAFKADVRKRIPWTWDTITGKAKRPGSDFDAHDGDTVRVRDYAFKAFAVVRQHPELYVAVTTSAGDVERAGYHLYIFSRDFHSRQDWNRLLKQVAALIGAPIENGICEIFPNESRGLPKPFSAPCAWNPKTGDCGSILYQTLSHCVAALPYGRERDGIALSVLCELPREKEPVHRIVVFFRGEHGEWQKDLKSLRRARGIKD